MKRRTEISAGGVVFREADGGFDVIIIRTHENRWQLPKGFIEHGEEEQAAAVREAREEGGVDSEAVGKLDTIEYWYNSTYEPEPARVHKFVHFYLLRYLSGAPEDHDHEVAEARWVHVDDAVRMLSFREERRIMSLARDALRAAAAPAPEEAAS